MKWRYRTDFSEYYLASGHVLILVLRTEKIIRRQNCTFYRIHLNKLLVTFSPLDGKKDTVFKSFLLFWNAI